MIHQKLKKIISLAPRNIEDVKKINNFILSKDPFEYFTLIKAIKYYNEKKYDSALVEFKKIETSLKNNAYLKFKIGMCYFKKGNWVNAIDYFEKAKKNKGYNQKWDIQYNAAKKNYRAKKINVNILKSEYDLDKDNIEKLYRYANALKSNASYWVAIHEIKDFKLKNNLDTKTKFLLSKCYEKLTNHEKAIEVLLDILGDEPDNPNYQYSMGFNLDCMGSNEAKKYYENFIFLRSYNQKDLHLVIGDINSKRGFWDKAVESYCKYEGENNKISNYEFYLKRASAYMKTFEWAKAISDYLNALNIMQYQTSEVLFECATCYEKNFDYYSASTFYKKAIRKANTFNSEWYYRCALMLEKIGKKDEALQFYQQMQQHQNLYIANKVFDTNEKKKRALYTAYYEELSIDDTDVLIESFLGNNFSCNPLAITKKLIQDKEFSNCNFYIVLNDYSTFPKELIDDRIVFVKRESDLYLKKLSSAKYLINNVSFPYYFIRKEGQKYLNTWHGTPLKTLGKDVKNPLLDYSNLSRNFLQATHIISQNNYTNEILLDRYDIKNLYSGKIAETGYPRVDSTLNITEEKKENIIEKLGLSGSKPIVLYAPTWRGTSESKSFDINKLLEDLKALESEDYDLIFKCHHFAEKVIKESKANVKFVDPEIDVNELLGCIDLLISDYSSIVFDYIKTYKPIISYAYDFEEYSQERGLYVDRNELVGIVVDNVEDLKEKICQNLGNVNFQYSNRELELVKVDDGKSTQRVIDFFFYDDVSYQFHYEKKPVHLMYTGPYLPNGILKSFTNLIENLKNSSDDDFCIVFNRQDVLAHSNRKEEFIKNIREDVGYLPRVGAVLCTAEEAWVRAKFESNFEKYSRDFFNTYIRIYEREARRLFGDTSFKSVVNFEGYSLFWSVLLTQMKSKNKLIFQHSDLYSEWKSKHPYLKGVFNIYENYDHIVSVSELTMLNNKKNLANLFEIAENKFEFSNNSILVDEIKRKALKEDDLLPEFKEFSGKRILNIGRLSLEKDQEKLIRSFKKSKLYKNQCRLYILGDGYLRDHLDKLIQDLDLNEYVYLLGYVDNPYVYMKQSDLFVLSSNHEGQPMVLLEALTLGTPILATDIIGNRSVLKGMEDLLCANNIEDLSKSMVSKVNNLNIKALNFDVNSYNDQAVKKVCSIIGC